MYTWPYNLRFESQLIVIIAGKAIEVNIEDTQI
jgi:hypothetical protein